MGEARHGYAALRRAAIAALAIATSTRAELSVDYSTLNAALQAAYESAGGCQNQQTQDSQTGTQSDGTEVTYHFTSYVTSCEESGRRAASLNLVQMNGTDGMSGNLDVSFNNNWDLYMDFASNICTLETASGESCSCEVCEAVASDSRKLVGATGSCSSPPSSDYPFVAGNCVSVTDLASGIAGGGGSVNAGDIFGVTFGSLSTDLKSSFGGSCVSSTNALNCSSSDGRKSYLSRTNEGLDKLTLNHPGQYSVAIDFAASSCDVSRSGSSCGDCALCSDPRANFGVVATCGSSDSINVSFSGVCNSIADLAADGSPSPTTYDIIANNLISGFNSSNCDSTRMQLSSNNATAEAATQYQLSCSGASASAMVTSLDNDIQTLSLSAGNAWYLSVDFPMHTCQVDVPDTANEAATTGTCSSCTLCRTTNGGYGVLVGGCPDGPAADAFSSTQCIGYKALARSSGSYSEDQTNTFDDISSDIQSVFSADTCTEQPGYLNCSHPDGRSAYLNGFADPKANGSYVPSALHVYNTGMYVIHLDFNTSDCSVELVNGVCDCTYCAVENGEFGIMSRCGESQTDYFRLKTGECVAISDICDGRVNEGDDVAEKTMPIPPFYLVVSDLEDAFTQASCTKGIDEDSYKVQLPNGTNVYKTRRFLQLNCSQDGRTAYVNKTDDDGVEILGRLNVSSAKDPDVEVSFDFEAETCVVSAGGNACANCTTCKYSNDTKYGISATCPDSTSGSLFSVPCVPIVELLGGAVVSPPSNGTSTGNGTNSAGSSNSTTADDDEGDDVWAEDPNNPGSGGSTDDAGGASNGGGSGTGGGGSGNGDGTTDDAAAGTDDADTTADDGSGTGSEQADGKSTSGSYPLREVHRIVAIVAISMVSAFALL